MDGNKDEALRCRRIAQQAIASRNKQRALKFIRLARRLNENLLVDDLVVQCEKLDLDEPASSSSPSFINGDNRVKEVNDDGVHVTEKGNYPEEHVQLIRQIKRNHDYYVILGVEKSCTIEEIRKAYRKLSLKVHPDKNKVPGSEEAFKKVCKAFKCLSDKDSRYQYDQTGLVDGFDFPQQQQRNAVPSRRRRTGQGLFEDDFDPNEIFRSFFGQSNMYRGPQVFGARGMAGRQHSAHRHANHHANHVNDGRPSFFILIQLIPFLLIFLLAYLPFSEPEYSLQQTYNYQFLRHTEKHEIDFFVKSPEFDEKFPAGSPERYKIEDRVIKDYKNVLGRYCHIELQRRQWNKKLPTPHCDKLQKLSVV